MSRFPSLEAARWYLAAIFDGEGHMTDIESPCHPQGRLSMVNTDPDIVEATIEALAMLGIRHQIYLRRMRDRNHKDIVTLTISRRSELDKVEEMIPLQHKTKMDRVKKANRKKRSVSSDNRPWEEIYRMLDSGMNQREVADRFNIHHSTFRSMMTRRKRQAA